MTGYRGGYLPNLRREIESGLRTREVMGVITSFNAGKPEMTDNKTGARIDEFDPTIFIFDSYPAVSDFPSCSIESTPICF